MQLVITNKKNEIEILTISKELYESYQDFDDFVYYDINGLNKSPDEYIYFVCKDEVKIKTGNFNKKKFRIQVEETRLRDVEVYAETIDEAFDIVEQRYDDELIVLEAEDHCNTRIFDENNVKQRIL